MGKVLCPYCGSSKTHQTAYGWGESIIKNGATFAIGIPIALAAHALPFVGAQAGHAVAHKAEEIANSNSCEYICESCHKTFGYSSGKGSKRR